MEHPLVNIDFPAAVYLMNSGKNEADSAPIQAIVTRLRQPRIHFPGIAQ